MVLATVEIADYRFGMNRLKELREKAGLSGPELARKVGAAAPEIWRLEQWPDKGGRKMTVGWANRLAPHLGVAPQDLLFTSPGPDQPKQSSKLGSSLQPKLASIRGTVAANQWFMDEEFIDEDQPLVPFIPGKYAGLEQFAFKVRGPCMDLRRILNGDYVVCVNYFDVRAQLTDGDIVVVERRRGQMTERTCKELKIVDGGFELWPRSTNPKFGAPIKIANRRDPTEEDGTVVEVVALVIGRFAPI